MSNMIYIKANYINWKEEARREVLSNDDMIELIKDIRSTKKVAKTNTKREEYIKGDHYKIDKKGDYVYLYTKDSQGYVVYSNNMLDANKNEKSGVARADRTFDFKFRELNGLSVRKAFGFVPKEFKRCIPKQFYYINNAYIGKKLIGSGIDANSQYPSGCLGKLPDSHTMVKYEGRVNPNEEYPFAFYKSGHVAEYGVFDTHNWMDSKLRFYLFRTGKNEPWPFNSLKDEEEETILMKASSYEMTNTWEYFYNIKQTYEKGTDEYSKAKLVMNKTIGCWHRKDKDKKSIMTYEDNGSYQLAHIVAIAIGRGNQKILNKLEEINPLNPLASVLHICVDGIIYAGTKEYGSHNKKLGEFTQEFTGCEFMMKGINLYCAMQDGKCVTFKHGGFDLLDGEEIDEDKNFTFEDLDRLSKKLRVGDIL